MSNEEIIRNACIKANPSILDLVFGCELITGNTALGRVIFLEEKIDKYGTHWKVFCPNMDNDLAESFGSRIRSYGWKKPLEPDLPIIGRPIRLADIILAIKKKDTDLEAEFAIKYKGHPPVKYNNFYQFMMFLTKFEMDGGSFWNLQNDDLSLQSQGTKELIANLLK